MTQHRTPTTELAHAPALLVLAAGMGSRYGGLKQIEPMGPNGEIMLDYSVKDAVGAGFSRVIFVIRKDIEAPFRAAIGSRYDALVDVQYAFQDLSDLPAGYQPPDQRTKPWGTGHAVYAARQFLTQPFVVINADDYYGRDAFYQIAGFFQQPACGDSNAHANASLPVCMVAYQLAQTLSPNGSVNRGICKVAAGLLQSVAEFSDIARQPDGTIAGTAPDGQRQILPAGAHVSMNFWGFTPDLVPLLSQDFAGFLSDHHASLKAEFYLPACIDQLIQQGRVRCHVMQSADKWFGVTYPQDADSVRAELATLNPH